MEREARENELVASLREKWELPDQIVLTNPEHFAKAMEFAEKLGGEAFESLKVALEHFRRVVRVRGEDWTVRIGSDFVPHSFVFCYQYKGQFESNGGVICHGLRGVETFSIELLDKPGIHWSIHT